MASASRPLTRLEQEILRRIVTLGKTQDRQLAEQIEDLVVTQEVEGELIFVSSPDAQGHLPRRAMARDLSATGTFWGSGGTVTDFIVFCDDDGKLSALEILNYDGITLDETTLDPARIIVSTESQ